jgi:hypothetical protein
MSLFEQDHGVKKYREHLRQRYRDIVFMQSCFDNEINCHSPKSVLRSLPNLSIKDISNSLALSPSEVQLLQQGRCLLEE